MDKIISEGIKSQVILWPKGTSPGLNTCENASANTTKKTSSALWSNAVCHIYLHNPFFPLNFTTTTFSNTLARIVLIPCIEWTFSKKEKQIARSNYVVTDKIRKKCFYHRGIYVWDCCFLNKKQTSNNLASVTSYETLCNP